MTEPDADLEAGDPATARDTGPIKPLRPWASRIFVTVALLAAAALGIMAARMMRDMSDDPAIQARFEAIEEMRRGSTDSTAVDSSGALPADSSIVLPSDSAAVNPMED